MERLLLPESSGGYRARQAAQQFFDWIRYQPPYTFVDADPYRAALLAAAVACMRYDEPRWWSEGVMPFQELLGVVQEYADDAASTVCESPEVAATFLLLVREALFRRQWIKTGRQVG